MTAEREPIRAAEVGEPLGDLACVGCGYNLNGLLPKGKCPECAYPIVKSLPTGDMLRPEQIHNLELSLRWITLSAIASLIGVFCILIGMNMPSLNPDAREIVVIVGLAVIGCTLFTRAIGYWGMTNPSTLSRPYPHIADTRGTIRTMAIATAALGGLGLIELTLGTVLGGPGLFRSSHTPAWVLLALALFSSIVGGVATLTTLESIADRIGDNKARKSMDATGWVVLVAGTVGIFLFFVGPLLAWLRYHVTLNNLRVAMLRRRIKP